MVKCATCYIEKPESSFSNNPQNKNGLFSSCKECKNVMQKEYRARIKNRTTHKYEKTKNGFLVRLYRNMKSRINGTQKKKSHLYFGKSILPKDTFYEWANNSLLFNKLYSDWATSGYNRKITPTVDRINPEIGYEIHNMRWLTHSENSRLGGMAKKKS